MLIRMVLAAGAIVACGCATDDDEKAGGSGDWVSGSPDNGGVFTDGDGLVVEPRGDDCASLGPCSSACDQRAIMALHVPAGTCEYFQCALGNGQQALVGGCNP